MINRRLVFGAMTGLGAATLLPARAFAAPSAGLKPGSPDDQGKGLNALLQKASHTGEQIFLPPGTYIVSGVDLPSRANLAGIPGATRLVHGGTGSFLNASNANRVRLSGLVIDGASQPLTGKALVDCTNVSELVIDDCDFTASSKNTIALYGCGGSIRNSRFSEAKDAGIFASQSGGLEIAANHVHDCGNGGILVFRDAQGPDGTIVTNNRVENIRADGGGTGQNGNGINVFRAGNVLVANNVLNKCAFSAVRANAGNNVQIIGNNCRNSGEMALYSEFAFEGAVISNNIIDGAASGISMVNFDGGGRMGTCTGNVVRNLTAIGPYPADAPGFGIGISVEADISVTANVIENAALYGIKLGWGPYLRNVVATGNVIRQAGTGIYVSVVEGVGSAIVTDNIIEKAPRGGIVGHRWMDAVTGDLARQNASGNSRLIVERNILS
ncbi:TIGR03808 family TAT-translocated repetitive protein [Phyllobacterium meliloti]|uniref:TIGR03808 family TAT-translocated repetitive protein n=1 Tax=Phyllobacterium meliloti TaxID=555317 RepID=UPI001D13D899|nr:TIGR03808 family TAT-translocated repetitive protein [Phyllobacterium sp. T1293]UGX84815.1 TIGR03808 family TAT-translocated repetitive protein [Phyllobacterium sp. T1293]